MDEAVQRIDGLFFQRLGRAADCFGEDFREVPTPRQLCTHVGEGVAEDLPLRSDAFRIRERRRRQRRRCHGLGHACVHHESANAVQQANRESKLRVEQRATCEVFRRDSGMKAVAPEAL